MSWVMTLSLVATAGLTYWVYWRWTHRRMLELAAKLPGPPTLPILGNALFFMDKTEEFLYKIEGIRKTYGEYFRFWLGPELNVFVQNPTDLKALLSSSKLNKKGPVYEYIVPFLGYGLISGGPAAIWRKHRKLATPMYNKKSLERYTPVFNVEAEQLARALTQKDPNKSFNVYEDLGRSSAQISNQTVLELPKEDSEQLYRMEEIIAKTHEIYDLIFTKMTKWWLQIPVIYWLTGKKKLHNYYKKLIDDFTGDIVRRRKKASRVSAPDEECMGLVNGNMLSGELSEREVKIVIFTLFTTSQEPIAKIAAAVLMILADLPDWQTKVYNEMMEVVGGDGPVTDEQLKQLQYLDMVFKEALRFFSIATLMQRTVLEEMTINEGKITLPVGTTVVIPPYFLHRDPRYWEDPDKVMPERFLPENVMKRDPNTFIPFSLGPMDCLGRAFAAVAIKTLVVWVLRYVHLEPAISLDNIKLDVAISATCVGGYTIKVRPRENRKH